MACRMQKEYDARMEELRVEVGAKKQAEVEQKIKIARGRDRHRCQTAGTVTEEEVKRLRKEADRFGMSSIDMQMRRDDIKNRKEVARHHHHGVGNAERVEAKRPPASSKFQEAPSNRRKPNRAS